MRLYHERLPSATAFILSTRRLLDAIFLPRDAYAPHTHRLYACLAGAVYQNGWTAYQAITAELL